MKPILAIELGTTKVACIVAQPSSDSGTAFELIGCGMASYPFSQTTGYSDPVVIASTVEQALERTKVASLPDRAVVAVSHPSLSHGQIAAQIDLSDEPIAIRTRDLQRLKAQALGQALGIDRDALLLDPLGYAGNGFEGIKDPRGLPATRLGGTFQLVTIPISLKKAITQAIDTVGVEMESLSYSLQAVAASLRRSEASRGGARSSLMAQTTPPSEEDRGGSQRVLVIDLGGECTDLAIIEQGTFVRSMTLAWGGMRMTRAIAAACRLTMEQALSVSLEGLASQKPTVRQLIEQQLRVLRDGLHRLLRDSPLPDRAIVSGRGVLIDGVVEWIETMTERPATVGRNRRAASLGPLGDQLAISPAIGLLELTHTTPSADPFFHASSLPLPRLVDRLLTRTKRILVDYF